MSRISRLSTVCSLLVCAAASSVGEAQESAGDELALYLTREECEMDAPGLFLEDLESPDGPAAGEISSMPGPINAESDNIYFNPGDILEGISFETFGPNRESPRGAVVAGAAARSPYTTSATFATGYSNDVVQLYFASGVEAVCVDYYGWGGQGTVDVEVYDTSFTLLGTYGRISAQTQSFFGVHTTGPSIGAIRFVDSMDFIFVDDVAFGNRVAEPPPEEPPVDPPPEEPAPVFLTPEAWPNPFSDVTTIWYTLSKEATVGLSLLDLRGREVAVLQDVIRASGTYGSEISALGLPSGTYIWRLAIGDDVSTGTVTLIR